MALSYKEARLAIMKSIDVVKKLVVAARRHQDRNELMDVFDALHRELAKLDSAELALSNDKYAALTLRFGTAAAALKSTKKKAEEFADDLSLAADSIGAMGKLITALEA